MERWQIDKRIVRTETKPCESGLACRYPRRPIVLSYDAQDRIVEMSEQGLIFTSDGESDYVRHQGCANPRLRELTARQAEAALSEAFEKAART